MAVKTVSDAGGNWNVAATWVPSGVPSTTADNVVFTTTSGPLTISATATIEAIDFRNYRNTITLNYPLTLTGNIFLGSASQTYSVVFDSTLDGGGLPRGRIRHTDTSTITSGGKTWSSPWQFLGSSDTFTITGTTEIDADVYLTPTTQATFNSGIIICRKNVIKTNATNILGTATFSFRPITHGTFSNSNTTGYWATNLDFRPDGGNLYLTGDIYYRTRVISGTQNSNKVITLGSILHTDAACTFNTDVSFDEVYVDSTVALTLQRDLRIGGQLTITGSNVALTFISTTSSAPGGFQYAGNVSFIDATANLTGNLYMGGSYPTITQLYNETDNSSNPGLYVRDLIIEGQYAKLNKGRIFIHRNLQFKQASRDFIDRIDGTMELTMYGSQSSSIWFENSGSSTVPGWDTYKICDHDIRIDKSGGTLYLGAINIGRNFTYVSGNLQNGVTPSMTGLSGVYQTQSLIIQYDGTFSFPQNFSFNNIRVGYRDVNIPTGRFRFLNNLTCDTFQLFSRYTNYNPQITTTASVFVNKSLLGGATSVLNATNHVNSIGGSASFKVGDKGYYTGGRPRFNWGSGGGLSYSVGDVVAYGASAINYRCILDHIADTTLSPTNSTYWELSNDTGVSFGMRPLNQNNYEWDCDVTITTNSKVSMPTDFGKWRQGGGRFQFYSGIMSNFTGTDTFDIVGSANLSAVSFTFSNFGVYATGGTQTLLKLESSIETNSIIFSPFETRSVVGGFATPSTQSPIYIQATTSISPTARFTTKNITIPTPGITRLIDSSYGWISVSEGVRFTSPVFTYNTIGGLLPGQPGAAGNICETPDFIFTQAATFSVETDCQIKPGVLTFIWRQGDMVWRNNSVGLVADCDIYVGNAGIPLGINKFIGNCRFRDVRMIRYGGSIQATTASIYSYDFLQLEGIRSQDRFNNFYIGGLLPTSEAFSYYNFRVDNATFSTGSLIIQSNTINNNYIFGAYNQTLAGKSDYIIDNFYLGTGSNVKYYFTSPTSNNELRAEWTINNFIGVSQSSIAVYQQPILIAGTFSTNPLSRIPIFSVSQNATQDLQFVNANNIDSSQGATIWSYKGILASASNWRNLPLQPKTISYIS